MFNEKIIKALVHPLFIGLLLTCAILIFISPDVSKYQVEIADKLLTPGITKIYFSDLDNDGNSEQLSIDNTSTLLKIMILKGKGLIAQYNLRSRPLADEYLYTADHNNDGYKEIYLLTERGDSVLLSIIDPMVQEDFILYERLIFHSETIHYKVDIPQGEYVGLVDFKEEQGKSLVFFICTGYSKQPRSVFKYNIASDELLVSPLSGASLLDPFLYDLNSDSVPEIFFRTAATGNYHTPIPYSDQSAWLMVLNKDLEFVFDPVEFMGYPSSLIAIPFKSGNSTQIAVLHDYYGSDTITPGLYICDKQGTILRSVSIELNDRGHYYLDANEGNNGPDLYFLDATKGIINVLNEALKVTGERSIPPLYKGDPMAKLDIDLNGDCENIFSGSKIGSFVVLQYDLTHPLIVDFEESGYPEYFTTVIRNGRGLFYSQFEDIGYILSYEKNPLFYLRFPLIALLYALVSALIFLIYRIQKYRAQMHFHTQKKISELQILALKNQIDPHFTFNILNSIGSLYSKGSDQKDAYNVFVKYSRLLRHAIQNSDKISVSLEEELDFVKNYIELEQFRNGYSFTYDISFDKDVDITREIPRMLIHSFVENSIKHGIRQLDNGGQLYIKITHIKGSHFITVRDNGPGLSATPFRKVHSTGKGMHIIDELTKLFNKLEGTKISYSLNDLSSDNTVHQGTEAIIVVPD